MRRYRARGSLREQARPEVARARSLIRSRIRRGLATRKPCVVCGAKPTHAHHPDYSRPSVVLWLCSAHHAGVHSGAYPTDLLEGLEDDTGTVGAYRRR